MRSSHSPEMLRMSPPPPEESALERLRAFVARRRSAREAVADLEQFEKEMHALFAAAECEVMKEELERLDVDVPVVEVEGEPCRRVLRCEETYWSAAGPVRVDRTLYRGRDQTRTVCPMELRAGVVEGRWTPLAAKQASWVVAHLTPQEGEGLFEVLGGMKPSKSTLDRLPKQLGRRWEENRESFEETLRQQETVPAEARTVAVSLDGVMLPMRDGERGRKRAEAVAQGRQTRGPAGHQETGCGTVSLLDRKGERLRTVRWGRMPEHKKATLKATLKREVDSLLKRKPRLRLVKLADGSRDNWTYLSQELPRGVEVVDFYHACEHLHLALETAYGEGSPRGRAQFEKLRHVLLEERRGVDKVIRSLVHLRRRHPRSKTIAAQLKYFRYNRRRMRYAAYQAQGLPVGSGVVEAACKTVVAQRMKRSGMRWRHDGGQAILTLRSLVQSARFERGWQLISSCYQRAVAIPENVVAFTGGRSRATVSM